MKFFKLVLIIFLFPNCAFCQIINPHEYIYNDSKDTIHFNKIDPNFRGSFGFCDKPKIIDSIQIDNKGRKEIVFYRFCRIQNDEHGGSFDISEKKEIGKYEIWNLDNKTLIFENITYLKYDYNNFRAGIGYSKGNDFYNYDFKIDSLGIITIKHFDKKIESTDKVINKKSKRKSIRNVSDSTLKPDKKEGVYKFIDGEYLKE